MPDHLADCSPAKNMMLRAPSAPAPKRPTWQEPLIVQKNHNFFISALLFTNNSDGLCFAQSAA